MRIRVGEEGFETNEQSYKGWEKGGSAGREVHDIVAEDLGLNVNFLETNFTWRGRFEALKGGRARYIRSFTRNNDLVVRIGKGYGCLANESFTISTKGLHKLEDLLTKSVRSSELEWHSSRPRCIQTLFLLIAR